MWSWLDQSHLQVSWLQQLLTARQCILISLLPSHQRLKTCCCIFVWLQSWRLLCGWRLSWWSPLHLERPDRKSGQNSGQKPQVRNSLCACNVIPDQTESGDLNFDSLVLFFVFLFLQLSHQLCVLVTFRNVRRQCGERLQGHPLVRHLTQSLKACNDGDVAGGLLSFWPDWIKTAFTWTRWTLKWLHVYVFCLSRSKLPSKRNRELNSWHLEEKSKVVWIMYVCVQME